MAAVISSKLLGVAGKFLGKKIAVIGDCMLDRYLYGDSERVSQEAPIPVIDIREETYTIGGAANAAANLASLGAKVSLFGVVGDDSEGKMFRILCKEKGILNVFLRVHARRPTTVKTRLVARGKQVARFDKEVTDTITSHDEKYFLRELEKHSGLIHAIVISDYAKGVLTPDLSRAIVRFGRKQNIPVIADPKPGNFWFFKNASALTPNRYEIEAVWGEKLDNEKKIREAGRLLQKKMNTTLLLTRGKDGMTLFQSSGALHFPAVQTDVADVAGAGDTATAAFALAIASGASYRHATEIALRASGIVVAKSGVATVSLAELKSVLV